VAQRGQPCQRTAKGFSVTADFIIVQLQLLQMGVGRQSKRNADGAAGGQAV